MSDLPTPHPRNRDFAWGLPRPAQLRWLTPEQVDAFSEDGFVVLRNVFQPSELEAVTATIDPLEAQVEGRLRESETGRDRLSTADTISFTVHLVKQSSVLRAFAAHPAIKAICHDLIGDDVRLYWDQAVYKRTGKVQEFPWHQDNGYTFIEPQQYLTLWIPLVDVDEENGCPWIAPRMHRFGTLQHWSTDIGLKCLEAAPDAVPAPAKAGDIIAFSSLAPHRTGPNLKTGSIRKTYILQYAPDGAIAYPGGGDAVRQDDPDRQFKILDHGR
jgi:phytanoyl-CoA hydroxylase